MSRFAAVVALVAVLLLPTAAQASHVGCGDVIAQDTRLDADLAECDVGLTIGAPDVTLDLAGHTIDGAGVFEFPAVYSDEPGTTIRRGAITGFEDAVRIEANNATVRHMKLFGALSFSGDGARLEHNEVFGANADDLSVSGSGTGARIVHNRVVPGGTVCRAMWLFVSDSLIAHNVLTGNGCIGAGLLVEGERNEVRKNRVSGFE